MSTLQTCSEHQKRPQDIKSSQNMLLFAPAIHQQSGNVLSPWNWGRLGVSAASGSLERTTSLTPLERKRSREAVSTIIDGANDVCGALYLSGLTAKVDVWLRLALLYPAFLPILHAGFHQQLDDYGKYSFFQL
jgi:hypothetical protein